MARSKKQRKNGASGNGSVDLIKAVNHPLRRRLLQLVFAREELSPIQASGILDRPLPSVSYHLRVLAESGALKLIAEIPRRGSVEHVYSATEHVKGADWVRLVCLDDTAA
jgi:DNA-binding transcriptional ArsR family regulator